MTWRERLRVLRIDVSPWRSSRDFRLLWAAGTVFYLGGMVSYVAIPFQIYTLTGSNLAVGMIGLVELVPLLVFGLYGGALADHVDRRRLLIGTGLAQAVLTGILAVNAFLARPSIGVIFVVAALLSAASSMQRPSREALLPRTVAHGQITAANAMASLGMQVGVLLGPAIGGLLVAYAGIGSQQCHSRALRNFRGAQMLLDNWLSQRAATCPDRTALTAGAASLTYAELEYEATGVARRLAARGARRGATVALIVEPGLDAVVLLHALMKLGAIAYPLNTRLTKAEIEAELARTNPALVIHGDPDLGTSEADLPLLGEHDLEAIHCRILTSGTSGAPRPVGLTYGNHLWSAVGSAFNLGVEPTDRWLSCLPLFHVGGLSIVMRSVIYGTTAVVHDGFDVDRIAASLEGDGVTLISVVATQLVACSKPASTCCRCVRCSSVVARFRSRCSRRRSAAVRRSSRPTGSPRPPRR